MTEQSLTLLLNAPVPPERLAQLTRDLGRDLTRAGVSVRPAEASAQPGERGDPITFGVITLAFFTSGAAVALLECLKAYLSRERTLIIKLTRTDGTLVEVTAQNVGSSAIREVVEAASSGAK